MSARETRSQAFTILRRRARALARGTGRSVEADGCFVLAPFAVGKRKPCLARPIRARVAPGNAQNSDRSASLARAGATARIARARFTRIRRETRRGMRRASGHGALVTVRRARFRIGGGRRSRTSRTFGVRGDCFRRAERRDSRVSYACGSWARPQVIDWRAYAHRMACSRTRLCATFRERKGVVRDLSRKEGN